MTRKEVSECFGQMLLAWPYAENFKGGIERMGRTIELWTVALSDVDFVTGMQATVKLCRESRFPPTIADFREAARAICTARETQFSADWASLRANLGIQLSLTGQAVLAKAGGREAFITTREMEYGDGSLKPETRLDYDAFRTAWFTAHYNALAHTGAMKRLTGGKS